MVSVVIRSMDRSELSDALASVALAEYDDIEVVVVNAKGSQHSPLPSRCGSYPLQLINADGPPMGRAAAANFGLAAARGEFALFLDDDDLVDPPHIGKLARALAEHPDAPAAYTGVRLIDGAGNLIREANVAWERDRLLGMNFLPIHAVLFRRALAQRNCSFDPQLEVLEDWDFWLQLARNGDFLNLPGCSAVYRMSLGESGLSSNRDLDRFRHAHSRVLRKWADRDEGESASSALLWFSTAVENLQVETADLQAERERLVAEISSLRDELSRTRWERDALLNSTSWKITAPLRAVSRWTRPKANKHD